MQEALFIPPTVDEPPAPLASFELKQCIICYLLGDEIDAGRYAKYCGLPLTFERQMGCFRELDNHERSGSVADVQVLFTSVCQQYWCPMSFRKPVAGEHGSARVNL